MSGTDDETLTLITELLRDRLSVDVADADTDLIDSGLLDSLALVMLIGAIEETFACELPLDDFDIERFRSVGRICQFLRSSNIPAARGS
jgi:acyl carrier protein